MLWTCPKCKVSQNSCEVKTVEIVEPGKGTRTEYHGKIRPEGSQEGGLAYTCLVCGYVWSDDPEDPTPGGYAATVFPYLITECCTDGCAMCDREAC